MLERGLPAKNDDAVYLLSLGASFAGKPSSNRSLSMHPTHHQITDESQPVILLTRLRQVMAEE